MNEHNAITTTTKLYGYIAQKAQSNRFSVTLNRLFKTGGNDAMMIPMNIREDDLYFTISNMRQSHLGGVLIGAEYRDAVSKMLDTATPEVSKSGFCDALMIRQGRLEGIWVLPEAIAAQVEALHVSHIAVLGSGTLAAALALRLRHLELSWFDPVIETLMSLGNQMERAIDINRLTPQSDLSGFDLVIDTMPQAYVTAAQGATHWIAATEMLEPYCETMYHILLKEWSR